MKISATARTVPNDTVHALQKDLFGDEASFELSTIRPEDASIAIEMLIGNYSAPIDAVIRELVVNAIDSHRAVGRQEPVEITMPTDVSPFFIVRDHGLGLSPTDMVGVYTRPAASTKRDENRSTGGLGIGAKAPFTVVDRFIVRGVKDGVSATLAMARINGQLKHRVHDITPVDDSTQNGVEVVIPVDPSDESIESWWKALSRVHFWWDAGLVDITNDAASPVNLPTWQERLLDDHEPGAMPEILVSPSLKTATVLMGQIGYQIPEGVSPTYLPVLYRLPVGAVTIAPTRESIVDNAENRAVLKKLLHAWQEVTFTSITDHLIDPHTSIWSVHEIRRGLEQRGLVKHFEQWLYRVHRTQLDEGILPKHGVQHLVEGLLPGRYTALRDHTQSIRPHGMPGETSARARSLADLFGEANWYGRHTDALAFPDVVFCDSRALPEGKRKILTKWARQENLVAVVVDRQLLEEARFARFWIWRNTPEQTRPFADPGQIQWVDPEDIQVERAPKKPAERVDETALVDIVSRARRHERLQLTVRELVDRVTGTRNGYVIVDTLAALNELPYHLPESILVMQSGQRPAKLVRVLAGKCALTAEQFAAKQAEIVLRALTPAQRRWVADTELARSSGVREYFDGRCSWIDETEDPAVRDIALRIRGIVTRANAYLDPRSELSKNNAQFREGIDYRAALDTVLRDQSWVIVNGALGKYLPALLAAESRGLGRAWSYTRPMVIEHIRATIATQLVKS